MIPLRAKRVKIFDEFTPEERQKYFGLKDKCVRTHIDTLYYFVRIRGDTNESPHEGMQALLKVLAALKEEKKASYTAQVDFMGLSVEATGFSIYEYRLSMPELFDIFITKYLPNEDTPRIVVQLRTRALILQNPYGAVENSFQYVQRILEEHKLHAEIADVNRVDYAYHTNIIQNPMKYFSDDKLRQNLRSTMRKYMKVGRVGDEITLETLSLGNRKSNNIFYRCYDKTCEVIEKAYKSFFIDKWKEDGLISEYDHYVLMYAYSIGSYVAGLHVGRMMWYIEFGHDEALKDKFRELVKKYRLNSDNNKALKKKLGDSSDLDEEDLAAVENVLPAVTRIMNIEFQTKRKFYKEIRGTLNSFQFPRGSCENPLLEPIFRVIALRGKIQEYLTHETVTWVEDRKAAAEDLKPLDWWHRIQGCSAYEAIDCDDLVRYRELGSDVKKTVRRLKNTLAHLQIMRNLSTEERSFHEDISDALCYLNDNDFYGFKNPNENREFRFKDKDYDDIRKRKARQDRGLVRSIQGSKAAARYKVQCVISENQQQKEE